MGQSADKNSTREILLEHDLKVMFCFAWIIFSWELPRGIYLKKSVISVVEEVLYKEEESYFKDIPVEK